MCVTCASISCFRVSRSSRCFCLADFSISRAVSTSCRISSRSLWQSKSMCVHYSDSTLWEEWVYANPKHNVFAHLRASSCRWRSAESLPSICSRRSWITCCMSASRASRSRRHSSSRFSQRRADSSLQIEAHKSNAYVYSSKSMIVYIRK